MSIQSLAPGARVLFQGDSITDAGRIYGDDQSLGEGYANMIAAWLHARHPAADYTFLNRGVGGNRASDLEARWSEDCIALKPDWVSILIGINDTWRRYDSNLPSAIDAFEACCRRLLDRVKTETSAQIILLEPFLLPSAPELDAWREDLDPRITAIRRVARDYQTLYLPLDGLFAAATTRQPPVRWAPDGVHPSQAGHALIARAWIEALSE